MVEFVCPLCRNKFDRWIDYYNHLRIELPKTIGLCGNYTKIKEDLEKLPEKKREEFIERIRTITNKIASVARSLNGCIFESEDLCNEECALCQLEGCWVWQTLRAYLEFIKFEFECLLACLVVQLSPQKGDREKRSIATRQQE